MHTLLHSYEEERVVNYIENKMGFRLPAYVHSSKFQIRCIRCSLSSLREHSEKGLHELAEKAFEVLRLCLFPEPSVCPRPYEFLSLWE